VFNGESLEPKDRYLPDGVVFAGSLKAETPDTAQVKEYVKHAWFTSPTGLNPADGQTVPEFTKYDVNAQYTWAKAPRYDGKAMEAGPLSRMLVAYLKGVEPVKNIVDLALEKLGAAGKPEVLVSLLGRVAARNLETAVVADWVIEWVNELAGALKGGDVAFFQSTDKSEGEGAGMWEAPRGALGHWMTVSGGRIESYQVCTPSTWNMGGRDDEGMRGTLEEALVGAPCIDPEKPMEAARIARSFDP